MKQRIVAACASLAAAAVTTVALAPQGGLDFFTYGVRAGMDRELDAPSTARLSAGPVPRERTEQPAPRELEPCSKWREVGPPGVVGGLPRNVPRRRLLCSNNGQPAEHLATDSSRAPS
jgi:hypothetical protein